MYHWEIYECQWISNLHISSLFFTVFNLGPKTSITSAWYYHVCVIVSRRRDLALTDNKVPQRMQTPENWYPEKKTRRNFTAPKMSYILFSEKNVSWVHISYLSCRICQTKFWCVHDHIDRGHSSHKSSWMEWLEKPRDSSLIGRKWDMVEILNFSSNPIRYLSGRFYSISSLGKESFYWAVRT